VIGRRSGGDHHAGKRGIVEREHGVTLTCSSPRAIARASRATNLRSMRSNSSRAQLPTRPSLSCAGSRLSLLSKSGGRPARLMTTTDVENRGDGARLVRQGGIFQLGSRLIAGPEPHPGHVRGVGKYAW
jgi:hypothetical protein